MDKPIKGPPSQLYLWDKRTLYIGPLAEAIDLSQGAATLTVSLDTEIEFTVSNDHHPVKCRSVLLPPGFNVSINTLGATIANCNLDPLGSDWAALNEQMKVHQFGLAYDLKNEVLFQGSFKQMLEQQLDSVCAYGLLEKIMDSVFSLQKTPHKIDPCVSEVVEKIKVNVDNNLTIEYLADSINISVPRLVQLFKQQTGVPIRRFRLWHRLFTTAVKMGQGNSLTHAAIAAGFTDSAHFSNTFRSMLGMKPSVILSQPNSIRLNTPV